MFSKNFEKDIVVEGMHCMHCAKKVEDNLSKIKGVKKVSVELETGKVKIVSKTELDDKTISTVIDNLGYAVK